MKAHNIRRLSLMAAVVIVIGSFLLNNILASMKEPPRESELATGEIPVRIRIVHNEAQQAGVDINGRLHSKSKFDVFTEVNGRLLETSKPFKDGVSFRKGEVLLKMDDTDVRLNLISNRSGLLSLLTSILPDLKIDFPKNYQLWRSYIADFDPSRELVDLPEPASDTEKNFLIARNVYNQFYTIRSAEAQLRKFTVTAPFDGVVSDANVNANTILRAGQRVGLFVDPIHFEMEAGINVDEVSKVSVGDKAVLKSSEAEGAWVGTIGRKSEMVDPGTQNVKVYLDVRGKDLYEGVYLNGSIIGRSIDSAITIPRYLLLDGSRVYTVQDGKLAIEPVRVLHQSNDKLIIQGLRDGDKIIDQMVPGAYEGMRVNIIE